MRAGRERAVPRPFTMPWGRGVIIEEATTPGRYHAPTVQLLRYEDGSRAVRFCSYSLDGRFQRNPLMVSEEDLEGLREALQGCPELRELLRKLVQ
jgi:hypothetical protein